MTEINSTIYGLELQSRALAPQIAASDEVRFFVATQSWKPNNQIHLISFNEESSVLTSKIYCHQLGEVWKLNASPHDPRTLISCFSCQDGAQVLTKSAIIKMRESYDSGETDSYIKFADIYVLPSADYGTEMRTTEFHPNDAKFLSSIVDNKIILWDQGEATARIFAETNTKNGLKPTTGKWSHQHQGNQFVVLQNCCIRSYDVRDMNHTAWSIDDAHGQLVRDLDCNPNKQCHIATGGDDGCLKIWDTRMPRDPVFVRSDHSHWVWNVRFNSFHDQLILTSSSDCKVLLTCAGSVSSENENFGDLHNRRLFDGLLQTFDQHEDSVYCVEWSNIDPWIFASLSYDGRVIISRVPRQHKFQILL